MSAANPWDQTNQETRPISAGFFVFHSARSRYHIAMHDELTPEQRFAAEDAETLVPRALLLGKEPEEVVADLVKLDWSAAAARAFVNRVIEDMRQFRESPESRQRLINKAFKQFVVGLVLAVVGLATMGLGFSIWMIGATGRIVLFAVPFCAFAIGLGLAGRGWARWRLYKNWAQSLEHAEQRKKDVSSSRSPADI